MQRTFIASLLVVSTLSASALAQPSVDATPPPVGPSDPTVAVTISPLLLIAPIVELTTEIRISDKIGVAAIAGAGAIRDKDTNELFKVFEGGVSPRYYVTGSFRKGIQLGAEAMYVHVQSDSMVDLKGAGLSLGGYVGYKWTAAVGFTFEGQLGIAYMAARAENTVDMEEVSRVIPLLNLNAGWSF